MPEQLLSPLRVPWAAWLQLGERVAVMNSFVDPYNDVAVGSREDMLNALLLLQRKGCARAAPATIEQLARIGLTERAIEEPQRCRNGTASLAIHIDGTSLTAVRCAVALCHAWAGRAGSMAASAELVLQVDNLCDVSAASEMLTEMCTALRISEEDASVTALVSPEADIDSVTRFLDEVAGSSCIVSGEEVMQDSDWPVLISFSNRLADGGLGVRFELSWMRSKLPQEVQRLLDHSDLLGFRFVPCASAELAGTDADIATRLRTAATHVPSVISSLGPRLEGSYPMRDTLLSALAGNEVVAGRRGPHQGIYVDRSGKLATSKAHFTLGVTSDMDSVVSAEMLQLRAADIAARDSFGARHVRPSGFGPDAGLPLCESCCLFWLCGKYWSEEAAALLAASRAESARACCNLQCRVHMTTLEVLVENLVWDHQLKLQESQRARTLAHIGEGHIIVDDTNEHRVGDEKTQ